MNAHAELAVRALEQMRGDEVERFEARYGTPDTIAVPALPSGWWDAPAAWNPGMSPREVLRSMRDRKARIDWAIGWVRSKG